MGKFDSDGLFQDEAILKEPDGEYHGNFLRGKKHGKGIYFHQQTNVKYEGEYRNGFKCGKGKMIQIDSDSLLYDGNWKNGLPDGIGSRF